MSLLWHQRQQKALQEFAVSGGLTNGLHLEPSTCCCSSKFCPNGQGKLSSTLEVEQLWLDLQTENIFCPHISADFVGFFTFSCRGTAQQGELHGKNCSCQVLTRPKFCHILSLVQTPNPLVQVLETKKKNKLFNKTNLSPTVSLLFIIVREGQIVAKLKV